MGVGRVRKYPHSVLVARVREPVHIVARRALPGLQCIGVAEDAGGVVYGMLTKTDIDWQ